MVLHPVNHATQHRSEIALALTQCGQTPGAMDFLFGSRIGAAEILNDFSRLFEPIPKFHNF
jgi:uncharacterized damage-inducible protein DinB